MTLPVLAKSVQEDAQHFYDPGEQEYPTSTLDPGNKPELPPRLDRGAIRVSSPNPSFVSTDDADHDRLGRVSAHLTQHGRRRASRSPVPPSTALARLQFFWVANKGLALVLISQLFGTLMNVTTRMLEMEGNDGNGYHPFQILFARMFITVVCASLYMWRKKIEHFPFGLREVRPLLVARGLSGFFGVFGMYFALPACFLGYHWKAITDRYVICHAETLVLPITLSVPCAYLIFADSLLYLPLADATVITFLAPSLACWACSYLINEPFTRMEQIAAYVSLFGVVIIARPFAVFSSRPSDPVPDASGNGDFVLSNQTTVSPDRLAADYDAVTPTQRATAVGIAMLGVLGAAGAYTTIRWIGRRAHPLISVNYFATWCTIVSIVAMFTVPGVGFLLPRYFKDWCYLIFLGICGFVMQFLLAAGLQYEKSSRATNMVYMQMLFALTFDKVVWGTTPGALSIVGSSLILGSAIYVAMHKEDPRKASLREGGDEDEERGLMLAQMDGRSEEHLDRPDSPSRT
ncbi:hypothetical protein FB567DRAFT_3835 [Paraphoma chrysanthemicola]|uniref:EamA domain-containing protein n=1 Tax=Paraphoma chrysanthemicola TaxID=798071 RepID=A0A8K0W3B8_9PLEO|nr:hypothetical protein FB567DRAFT_3835 [Paraphoma chrysanthemicola]